MKKNNEELVSESEKPSKKMKDFMGPDSDEHLRQSLSENIEIWVDAATYGILSAGNWEDRLSLIMMAKEVTKSGGAAEWSNVVSRTHVEIGSQQVSQSENNHDALARSFYLRTALMHLLDIVEAPFRSRRTIHAG